MFTRSHHVPVGAALVAVVVLCFGQGCMSDDSTEPAPEVIGEAPAMVEGEEARAAAMDTQVESDVATDTQVESDVAGGTICMTPDGAPYESESC
jgi:hypothetical protein